jgi:hypothetical protein
MISTCVNFSNSWLGSLGEKHLIFKNHKAQFLVNQMLKDEIEKKINYTKVSKQKKIAIKRMRIKIEKKTKLKDNYNFFIK